MPVKHKFTNYRIFVYTAIPHFSKARFTPLHFYKRPTLVPVFANRKKSKEDFQFYEEM